MLVARDITGDITVDIMGDDAGGITGDTTRWMTYGEMAVALRIKASSARRLAQRRRWPRRQNNRGEASVGVPIDALPSCDVARDVADDVAGDAAPAVASDVARDTAASSAVAIAALAEQLARLTRELDATRILLDAAKGEGTSLKAAHDALVIEVSTLEATLELVGHERDRWHSEATRPILARLFRRRAA